MQSEWAKPLLHEEAAAEEERSAEQGVGFYFNGRGLLGGLRFVRSIGRLSLRLQVQRRPFCILGYFIE